MPAAAVRDKSDTPPAPEPKTGRWEALTPLSISRPAGAREEKMADLVQKGEIVELTEEQSQGFLTRHKRPVIRPAREQNQAAPDIKARDLFGARPKAAQFGAREDPPNASAVIETDPADPRNHPEANDPVTDLMVDPDSAKDK